MWWAPIHIWFHLGPVLCSSPGILWVFFLFCFCYGIGISNSPIIYTSHFFATQTSLDCRKYLIGRLFYGKLDELLPRSLYRICVAVHVIKVRKEEAMDDAALSQYREREREREREQADQHINQNVIAHHS